MCARRRARAREVICLPELFRAQYFCQREDIALFDLAEPIPGPSTERLGRRGARGKCGRDRLALRAARAGPVSQHRGDPSRPTDRSRDCTARCTSPTIRSTTRSSTSRRATSASARSTRRSDASARWSAGTSGIPKGARITALQGANVLFYPTAIGWHPAEKDEYGDGAVRRVADHPARARDCQRRLRRRGEPRGLRARRRARQSRRGAGLEFWGGSFMADPFGRIIAKAAHDREEILIAEIDPAGARRARGATGRSCATAASMRMRRLCTAFWIRRSSSKVDVK